MARRFTLSILALGLLAMALAVAGCGAGSEAETSSPPPDYASLLAGSPPPLAALHAQENELLEGGIDAYEKRIEELRGFPVVVNVWASWCGPCRIEFPYIQDLSARYGKRVAFLGVNSEDDLDAAATFLESHPVPYPSYVDKTEIADSLGGRGLPRTAYYDAEGNLCVLKQGQYADQEAMEADLRAYALSGRSCADA